MKDEPTGFARRLSQRASALSLRSKLMLIIAGVSVTTTALAMLASFAIELTFFRARLLEEYRATARMLASNLEAAVAFEDARDSQEVLAALEERAFVASAGVYLGDGTLLASYRRSGASEIVQPPAFGEKSGLRGDALTVNEPIAIDGQLVGQVALRADLEEVRTFLSARSLIFGLVLAAAAALCFVVAARFGRMMARPIRDLAATARRITAQQDFSTRHARVPEDETGQLVDAFNEMMAEIERRNAETVKAKEAAEASSRAKDDFLSVISHELRTPMNPIIGYTQVLLKKPRSDEDARHLSLIRRSAEHLLGLIDDILDYSRFERGVASLGKESVDYRAVCHDAIVLLDPEAREKGLTLAEMHAIDAPELRARPFRILTDEVKFRQIVLNFLSNAIKFTESGSVALRTRLSGAANEPKRLHVEVVDTGIGIEGSDRDKIFKPFSQIGASLTRTHSGMGLGLAISRKIVEAMGGKIGFESAKSGGSRFWFDLPVKVDLAEPDRLSKRPAPRRPIAAGKRVLLVDDQLINRELARGLIAERGLEVVCAKDGLDALDKSLDQDFDLIILDVKMPRMDGYETARALRQREAESGARRTPIVAMTAHITTRGSQDSIESGMDDFIAKPFDLEKLDTILEKWLA